CPLYLEHSFRLHCPHTCQAVTVTAMDRDAATEGDVTSYRLRSQWRATTSQCNWQVTNTLDLNRRRKAGLTRSGAYDGLVRAQLYDRCRNRILDDGLGRGSLLGIHLPEPRTHLRTAMWRSEIALFRRKPIPTRRLLLPSNDLDNLAILQRIGQ